MVQPVCSVAGQTLGSQSPHSSEAVIRGRAKAAPPVRIDTRFPHFTHSYDSRASLLVSTGTTVLFAGSRRVPMFSVRNAVQDVADIIETFILWPFLGLTPDSGQSRIHKADRRTGSLLSRGILMVNPFCRRACLNSINFWHWFRCSLQRGNTTRRTLPGFSQLLSSQCRLGRSWSWDERHGKAVKDNARGQGPS